MSYRTSSYIFKSEKQYETAREQLYNMMYQDWRDPDKLYFDGWIGGGEYQISIMDGCSNPVDAARYCREQGGVYRTV